MKILGKKDALAYTSRKDFVIDLPNPRILIPNLSETGPKYQKTLVCGSFAIISYF
ncbi:hypothetical protein [uncultured Sphaerochaeta sp.]|uniref:hypothetical protein n=1 Tax=uncultured Sphaerochaeta sp. TaxID=886478 RepID=UPI002A0A422B|nr:hypothetical protein [uncultured Sphaerochaeta sp.]